MRRTDGLYEPLAQRGKGGDFQGGPGVLEVQPGSLEGLRCGRAAVDSWICLGRLK